MNTHTHMRVPGFNLLQEATSALTLIFFFFPPPEVFDCLKHVLQWLKPWLIQFSMNQGYQILISTCFLWLKKKYFTLGTKYMASFMPEFINQLKFFVLFFSSALTKWYGIRHPVNCFFALMCELRFTRGNKIIHCHFCFYHIHFWQRIYSLFTI